MLISTFVISYFVPQPWSTITSISLISIFQEVIASEFRNLDFPDNKKAEEKRKPNEGVWQSVNNSLLVIVTLVLVTFIIQISCTWILGIIGLNLEVTRFAGASTLMLGGFTTVAVSLFCGGWAALQHLVIRLILTFCEKSTPFNYSKCLDWLSDRLLLQRIGGGYIFINRLLMEYLDNERKANSNNSL